MKLKQLSQQVAVVMGASSGIGRDCAVRLAERGAKVVVAARGEEALQELVAEIISKGGEASYVVCDVSELSQVLEVADKAVTTYGRIDTWVSVAGVVVQSPFEQTDPEDFRRLMETNYLGTVYGAYAALPRLREAGGGAFIVISSAEGKIAIPNHSAYSASKHAVEGFIEALRRDLLSTRSPISVTSIKPASIATPIMDDEVQAPPPIYPTSVVADCLEYAAQHKVRDLWAGGSGRAAALGQALAPWLMDHVLIRIMPPEGRPPVDEYRERRFSSYAWLGTHPRVRAGLVAGGIAGVAALALRRRFR